MPGRRRSHCKQNHSQRQGEEGEAGLQSPVGRANGDYSAPGEGPLNLVTRATLPVDVVLSRPAVHRVH